MEDTLNAVAGAVDFFNFRMLACFQVYACQGGIDGAGRAAGLCDNDIHILFLTIFILQHAARIPLRQVYPRPVL